MINFHEQMEIYACAFEIEVNGQVQKQMLEAPRMMIEGEFVSLMQQAAQHPDPVKITMSRQVPIYDNFNNEWVKRENSVTFKNNAYRRDNE